MPVEPLLISIGKSLAGAVAKGAYQRFQQARFQYARNCMLQAIADGNLDMSGLEARDDFLEAMTKYLAATRDGVARRNLRIMAYAIAGLLRDRNPISDEFDRLAPVLSRLTEQQIATLVHYTHNYDAEYKEKTDHGAAALRASYLLVAGASSSTKANSAMAIGWELCGMGLFVPQNLAGGLAFAPSQLARDVISYATVKSK